MKKILFALMLVLASSIYAQEDPLKLTIKSSIETYKLGEEIIIHAEFKNNSIKTVTLEFSDAKPHYYHCSFGFDIRRNNVEVSSERIIYRKEMSFATLSKELHPGTAYAIKISLDDIDWAEGNPFKGKGNYTIRIRYGGASKNINRFIYSNFINFTIT